jgi:mannose-1-phosphate guanylyltransferase
VYTIIMAGGGGTRLWPLSRGTRPKPFLPLLDGGRSLLEASVERLSPLVEPHDVYIVTDVRYADMVRELVPAVPASNIIGEPRGRNTAAAVALVAAVIDRPTDEVMLVLPADPAIENAEVFRAALKAAAERADTGDMVTIGVEPTGPETGYGYVIASGEPARFDGRDTFRVARFEEKPTPERADELISGGDAFWNAGIFVWRRDTLLDGLHRHAADIIEPIEGWFKDHPASGTEPTGWPGPAIADVYDSIRATSIDYALLEPASLEEQVAVVPADFGWSDLGSWSALRDQRANETQTVVTAEAPATVIDVGGKNVLVHAAGGRLVAIVGLENIVVVDTPDALLVSSVDAAQDVKQVVDRLKEQGREELL